MCKGEFLTLWLTDSRQILIGLQHRGATAAAVISGSVRSTYCRLHYYMMCSSHDLFRLFFLLFHSSSHRGLMKICSFTACVWTNSHRPSQMWWWINGTSLFFSGLKYCKYCSYVSVHALVCVSLTLSSWLMPSSTQQMEATVLRAWA